MQQNINQRELEYISMVKPIMYVNKSTENRTKSCYQHMELGSSKTLVALTIPSKYHLIMYH